MVDAGRYCAIRRSITNASSWPFAVHRSHSVWRQRVRLTIVFQACVK
jgi:hypothetical protein